MRDFMKIENARENIRVEIRKPIALSPAVRKSWPWIE